MTYNTKAILTDVNQKPIPQFYDAVSDVYRQLTGQTLGGDNYGSNAVSWGKTAGGLFAPVAVNDSGHVQSDILSSALPSGAATQATLAAVLAKLSSDPATQTTLAAILSKIISAPATEAKQDALNALIGEVQANPTANTLLGRMKSLESKIDTLDVVIDSILAKIIAAPSTEAKQDTIIGYVDGVEAVLASILAKIIASPATEAKQTALNALIGEAQASPTANTLLARLKSLEDKLAETLTVQLSGSYVEIGGKTYVVSGGDTIRGKAADKPDAVAAHAAIPFCYYHAIDTGAIEVTDGTNWVVI